MCLGVGSTSSRMVPGLEDDLAELLPWALAHPSPTASIGVFVTSGSGLTRPPSCCLVYASWPELRQPSAYLRRLPTGLLPGTHLLILCRLLLELPRPSRTPAPGASLQHTSEPRPPAALAEWGTRRVQAPETGCQGRAAHQQLSGDQGWMLAPVPCVSICRWGCSGVRSCCRC